MSLNFDASELRAFAADLGKVPFKVARAIPPVVLKGSMNIKDQLREEMNGSEHFSGAAHTVGFDILDGGFASEIGPSSEAGSPGNLANLAYFGGSNGGGGTVEDPRAALDAEEPKFLKALADLAEGAFDAG